MKTLLKNGTVICFEQEKAVVKKNCSIAVDGDTITYVGENPPADAYDTVRDMSAKIVFPGLYNCHTHSPMVLLRGVGSDLPLDKWLFGEVCPIEDNLTPEDISAGSYLALLEMLSCGTVSFSDMYFEPQTTADAVIAAGMKANISRPVQCFDPSENPKDSYRIKQSLELYDNYHGRADGRLLVDFCVHAEYTCNEKTVAYYSELVNARNGNLHIHLSETEKEHNECLAKYKKTPAKWFEDLGAFDSHAFAAHCIYLEPDDIGIFRKHNISVAHNPTSNLKLGSGVAPVQKYADAGLNVTIGTDGAASNNNLDMMEELHIAALLQNGFMKDATVMKAGDVLKMATLNGARLQGRKNCGNIAPGFKADIAAVDTRAPHLTPCLDALALIVYSAHSSDICLTMADGKILYENGEYKTLDTEKIYYDVNKAVERLYRG